MTCRCFAWAASEQPVLQKSGDDLRIDWGYLYVVAPPGSNSSEAATAVRERIKQFSSAGRLPGSDEEALYRPYAQPMPVLAETFDLGSVGSSPVSRHVVLAYDDIFRHRLLLSPSRCRIGVARARRLANS